MLSAHFYWLPLPARNLQEDITMSAQPRLERQNGIIAGVCGGIAVRFGWSLFIVRLIFFILLLPE
jgi:hypothetical protein